jgi:hypothetical protein
MRRSRGGSIMRIKFVVVAAGAMIVTGCGDGAKGVATSTETVTVTVTAPPGASTDSAAPSTAPTHAPSATFPGEGTFRVGVDVQPGTYTSSPSQSGVRLDPLLLAFVARARCGDP